MPRQPIYQSEDDQYSKIKAYNDQINYLNQFSQANAGNPVANQILMKQYLGLVDSMQPNSEEMDNQVNTAFNLMQLGDPQLAEIGKSILSKDPRFGQYFTEQPKTNPAIGQDGSIDLTKLSVDNPITRGYLNKIGTDFSLTDTKGDSDPTSPQYLNNLRIQEAVAKNPGLAEQYYGKVNNHQNPEAIMQAYTDFNSGRSWKDLIPGVALVRGLRSINNAKDNLYEQDRKSVFGF